MVGRILLHYVRFIEKVQITYDLRYHHLTLPCPTIAMTDHSSDLKSDSTARITRSTSLRGDLKLPGDKSISHRAAMISALGNGITRIENYSSAVDCQNTLDCLVRLGVVDRAK